MPVTLGGFLIVKQILLVSFLENVLRTVQRIFISMSGCGR